MNRTELEEIIKSCDVNIAKLELAKAEAVKELGKKDEVPECYNETNVRYYLITFDGSVSKELIHPDFEWDKDIPESHRAFKTKKIAKLFTEKIQIIADQLYFKELYDADYVPDWDDEYETKFYVVYSNYSPRAYIVNNCRYFANYETVYFSSKEIAQKCADWLNSRKGQQ